VGALVQKTREWFLSLNQRERVIVGITIAALGAYAVWLPIELGVQFFHDRDQLVVTRTRDYNQIGTYLERYTQLDRRFSKLQSTFKESEMTFEEVTSELDKIIKNAVGNIEYDLEKARNPSDMGLDFSKQEFTVKIKSLNLPQLVALLYNLEQGETPLFLGGVDISKSKRGEELTASLEIFSISSKS
jgi:hypothetical protein